MIKIMHVCVLEVLRSTQTQQFARRTLSLSIWWYTQLWFLPVKRYRDQSAKGKVARGEVQGRAGTSFHGSLTVESHNTHLILPVLGCDKHCHKTIVQNIASQGSSLETEHPGFLLWAAMYIAPAGHVPNLKNLSEGKQVFSINHSACMNSLGTVSPSYLESDENPSKV